MTAGAGNTGAGNTPGRIDAARIADVDAVFRARVERGVAPSSAWGVFDTGGLVASGGHGDRGDGIAPDADTVYRIASCTKSVTAMTLLTLVDEQRIDLDAPVTRYVPAFTSIPLPTADSPVPTLRMLLTMSGGFPTDDPWADRQESLTDDAFDAVLRDGLLFDSVPGTRFAYSNLGYALLGRAIAVAAGARFVDLATDRVLRPLGLTSTRFAADALHGFVVTGTRPHGDGFEPLPTTGPGAFSPIGGLFSTVRDLSAWGTHLASAFASSRADGVPTQPGPLSAAARRWMQQGARVIPSSALPGATRPTAYGAGLFVEQDDRVGAIVQHSGGYPGFSAHMRWSVETGIGVVAFENATQAKVSAAADRALDILLGNTAPDTATPSLGTGADSRGGGAGRVLPETRAAQVAVSRLLADWHDDLADAICTPNVAMDVPYDRRRAAIADAVARTGADLSAAPVGEESRTPTHLRWWLPGSAGRLRVEIRLAPLAAGRVQTLLVAAEPDDADRPAEPGDADRPAEPGDADRPAEPSDADRPR